MVKKLGTMCMMCEKEKKGVATVFMYIAYTSALNGPHPN